MLIKLLKLVAKWSDFSSLVVQRSILIVASLTISTLMVVEILARYVFEHPMLWLEEPILIAVLWLYLIGAAMATRDRSHIKASVMHLLIKDPQRLCITKILATLIALVMSGCLIYWSSDLFFSGLKQPITTPILAIPLYVSQSSLFFGGILIAIYFLHEMVDNIRTVVGHKASPERS